MKDTESLCKLMKLDASMNTSDIEIRFREIAEQLFRHFAIQQGEKIYLFKEIEFYFYNQHHRDIITHPRESEPLRWYVNDFGGIDLNFASRIEYDKASKKFILDDNAFFGGILLSSVYIKNIPQRKDSTKTLLHQWSGVFALYRSELGLYQLPAGRQEHHHANIQDRER